MIDEHGLARSHIATNERKSLPFFDKIEQRREDLLMACAEEKEALIQVVFEGGTGKTIMRIIHLRKPRRVVLSAA